MRRFIGTKVLTGLRSCKQLAATACGLYRLSGVSPNGCPWLLQPANPATSGFRFKKRSPATWRGLHVLALFFAWLTAADSACLWLLQPLRQLEFLLLRLFRPHFD